LNCNIKELKEMLKKNLSKKRYEHSLNVAANAKKLAVHYNLDGEKAYFAGLLHDCCKESSAEELKNMVLKSNLDVDEAELISKPLWHAIAGAVYIRDNLGVTDSEIISAVRYHTVAKEKMSNFEEIIYLADMISEDRTFDGVEKLRKSAYTDLENAMLECVKFSIIKVINKNGFIPLSTFKAYNYYLDKCGING
jgi:nicotinate-nucleotide adenylyltransferase